MTLRFSLTGQQVCLPGVSTAQNGWTVPAVYHVCKLLGVLVFKVAADGTVDPQGEWFRVSGVLLSNGSGIAPPSFNLADCNPDSDVAQLLFGAHVVDFTALPYEDRDCHNVDGVRTPSTPDPFVDDL